MMWLESDVFDETAPYSHEAEAAMTAAAALMAKPDASEQQAEEVRTQLRKALADTDPFWLNWRSWRRSKGWSP